MPTLVTLESAGLTRSTVDDKVFIATGAAIFHSSRLGKGSQVRINGVVHIKSRLPPESMVPIGWVAVGEPARILPPDQHEGIWEVQKSLNFRLAVYGLDQEEASMVNVTRRLSEALASHNSDEIV